MQRVKLDVSPLFTSCNIGQLKVPGRVVLPGMQRSMGVRGAPTEAMARMYRRYAEGGCKLIISESTAVDHPSASRQPACVRITPATQAAWARCIDEVHAAGGKIFIQLWHEGAHRPEVDLSPEGDGPTISPSGLAGPGMGFGRPATLEQLQDLREAYARSAMLARNIGADGVEVHAAHGYLLDQFIWSKTNVRDDMYGGPDLRNRMRFPLEVVQSIRAATGPDFPVSLRFSQFKMNDYSAQVLGGPDELRLFVEAFRAAGVDAFHVSTRRFHEAAWSHSPLSLAGWVKSFTDAAVIAVGSVGVDIDMMQSFGGSEAKFDIEGGVQELLRRFGQGEFDFIAIGRSQIGDPEWVSKAHEGRLDEIRHFTRHDLIGNLVWDRPTSKKASN